MREDTEIQMPLRGEGVDVWRPVHCQSLGGELYLVNPQAIPITEDWAFLPEQIVRCTPTLFAGGERRLAATGVVSAEPETVRHWLELHDSVLNPYTLDRAEGQVRLDGYLHRWERRGNVRFGRGFVQEVTFRFSGLTGIPQVRATRSDVSGGSVVGSDQMFANMMPIPLDLDGHVQLSLTLCDGSLVEIRARSCQIAAIGDARFVEVLLPDLDPEPA